MFTTPNCPFVLCWPGPGLVDHRLQLDWSLSSHCRSAAVIKVQRVIAVPGSLHNVLKLRGPAVLQHLTRSEQSKQRGCRQINQKLSFLQKPWTYNGRQSTDNILYFISNTTCTPVTLTSKNYNNKKQTCSDHGNDISPAVTLHNCSSAVIVTALIRSRAMYIKSFLALYTTFSNFNDSSWWLLS